MAVGVRGVMTSHPCHQGPSTWSNTNRRVSVWKCLWDLNRCITGFTIIHRCKGKEMRLFCFLLLYRSNKRDKTCSLQSFSWIYIQIFVWNSDGPLRSEKWSQCWSEHHSFYWPAGGSTTGCRKKFDSLKAHEKMILLLTWYITSVNRLQTSFWSRSLLLHLLHYSMMFIL